MDGVQEATRIVDRIHVHWPKAQAHIAHDAPVSMPVRVRIADSLWLELHPPKHGHTPWTVAPVTEQLGKYTNVENTYGYGIGVRANADPEAVADRFYEEVRFWWNEYEVLATRRD